MQIPRAGAQATNAPLTRERLQPASRFTFTRLAIRVASITEQQVSRALNSLVPDTVDLHGGLDGHTLQ